MCNMESVAKLHLEKKREGDARKNLVKGVTHPMTVVTVGSVETNLNLEVLVYGGKDA